MGAVLSLASPRCRIVHDNEHLVNASYKRQKTSFSFVDENPRLISGLPDELSMQILARLPRICYFDLRLVSRKWRATIMGPELFKLRKELQSTEEWLYLLIKVGENKLSWHALDPLSRKWMRLPPMPNVVYEEESWKGSSGPWLWGSSIKIAEVIRSWFGQKNTFDQLPFCGCAIGAVDGCLYVLGGFSKASTMRCVWRFDPVLNEWSEMASMSTGRAYCKTGILNNKLYVVGGVNCVQGGLTPLHSAEVFDPCTGTWSEIPSIPSSRTQLHSFFWSDTLKPMATGMASYMGKLFVPLSLYSYPFFLDAGGKVYDPKTKSWAEMPTGMGEGWPARHAGTKLSVVVDGELYAFDPSSSVGGGKIKVYDQEEDSWEIVIGKVPIYNQADSESPYLLAGFHGKIHFITKDVNYNIAVMQADVREAISSSQFRSTSLSVGSMDSPSVAETETVVWKVISSKDFGSAELFGCQVLDI